MLNILLLSFSVQPEKYLFRGKKCNHPEPRREILVLCILCDIRVCFIVCCSYILEVPVAHVADTVRQLEPTHQLFLDINKELTEAKRLNIFY